MPSDKSIFLCQKCGWKKVCELDESGLLELKNDSMSSRKFRCPGCGMAITPRPFQDPQRDLELKFKDEKIKKENEEFVAEANEFRRKFAEEMGGD